MNLTDALLRRVRDIQELAGESSKGEAEVRLTLLDYIPVLLAGISKSAEDDLNASMLKNLVAESDASRAFAYGYASHRLELDDGYRKGGIHIGAPVLSALLAVASDASWNDMVAATYAGYEVAGRIAAAIQPNHKRAGFHASGTCGCIGASAALGVLEGFNDTQLKRCISAAAGMASGLLEMQEDGSQMKPINIANASSDAVMASKIGRSALAFPNDALGGPRGLAMSMSGHLESSALEDHGATVLESAYHKLYPTCRHGHPAIDAALSIRISNGFDPSDVESITVYTYIDAISGHDLTDINSASEAMMSTPYCVASALLSGREGPTLIAFEESLNSQVVQLAQHVAVCEDPKLTELAPEKRSARVEVQMSDGTILSETVMMPKGEPENPASEDELRSKAKYLLETTGLPSTEAGVFVAQLENWNKSATDLNRLVLGQVERILG